MKRLVVLSVPGTAMWDGAALGNGLVVTTTHGGLEPTDRSAGSFVNQLYLASFKK